jgi:hypothetical protein
MSEMRVPAILFFVAATLEFVAAALGSVWCLGPGAMFLVCGVLYLGLSDGR